MSITDAIRRYFHGESKELKVSRFESLTSELSELRSDLSSLVSGINSVSGSVDTIKKSANLIIADPTSSKESVAVALDNIMLSDSRLSGYVSDFSNKVAIIKSEIFKYESELVELITDNPDMASIICDVTHDDGLEKSLSVIAKGYSDGVVTKSELILAYKKADVSKRTDRSFEGILDILKDK